MQGSNLKQIGFNFGSCKLYREKVLNNNENFEDISEKVTTIEMLSKICETIFFSFNLCWKELLEDLMLFENLKSMTALVITSARFSEQFSSMTHNNFVQYMNLLCKKFENPPESSFCYLS